MPFFPFYACPKLVECVDKAVYGLAFALFMAPLLITIMLVFDLLLVFPIYFIGIIWRTRTRFFKELVVWVFIGLPLIFYLVGCDIIAFLKACY
jgi:hypothetical protein